MCRNPHECAVAKIVTRMDVDEDSRRNPHECAVAKVCNVCNEIFDIVATRTNALWQSHAIVVPEPEAPKI